MYAAVDFCLEQLEVDGVVDIYSAVLHLRRYRKNAVQTLVCKKVVSFSLILIYHNIIITVICLLIAQKVKLNV